MGTIEEREGAVEDPLVRSILELSPAAQKNYSSLAAYILGKNFYDKADLNQAEKYFLLSLQEASFPRDYYSAFKTLGFLIQIASERLEDTLAQTHIAQSVELIERAARELPSLGAEYFYSVGVVKNYQGDFTQARQNFLLAAQKAQEENSDGLLSKCLLSLAVNAYNRSDFEQGMAEIEKLTTVLKTVNKTYLMGAMYFFTARLFLKLENFAKARQNFTMANLSLQKKNCWNLFGYILLGKGASYKLEGDYGRALGLFELGLEVTDKSAFKRLVGLIEDEIDHANDDSVDLHLDKSRREVREKTLGVIDFRHRFVLLEILFLLAKNPGTYFDKEQLAKSIWMHEYNPLIHDKLIYTNVSRLRKLIEPKGGQRRKYLIRGKHGYTFNPEVKIRFHRTSRPSQERSIGNVELGSPV